ncbi:hypothetical protein H4R34_003374 [Dimargaris verticillata]|uniref:Uncharacterized protein n=1 Tax=Dimargaris verticillata TaxID=2761393 RepID=A0A9W8B711_9FUNG|nr:hypothetical protein H4R34_003374 [Dimargaris verticillata]
MAAPPGIPNDIQQSHSLASDYFILARHLPSSLTKDTLKQHFRWDNDHVYLQQASSGSKAWLVTSILPKALGLIKRFNASWWQGQCLDISLAKPHCQPECAVSFGVKMKDVRKRYIVHYFSQFGVVVHAGLQYHDKYLMTMGQVYFDTRRAASSVRSRHRTLVFMEKPMGVVAGIVPLGKLESEVLQRGKAFLKQQTRAQAKSSSSVPTAAPSLPSSGSTSPRAQRQDDEHSAWDKGELEIVFDNDDTSSFPLTGGIEIDGERTANGRGDRYSNRSKRRNLHRDRSQSPERPWRNSDRYRPSDRFSHSSREQWPPHSSHHSRQRDHRRPMPAAPQSPSRRQHPPRDEPKSAPFRPPPPKNSSAHGPFQPSQGNLIGVPTNTPIGVIPVYQRSDSLVAPLRTAPTQLPPPPQRPRAPPKPSDYFPLRCKVSSPPPPTPISSAALSGSVAQTAPPSSSILPAAEADGDILLSGNIFTRGQSWKVASSPASHTRAVPSLSKATFSTRAAAPDKSLELDALDRPTTSAISGTPASPAVNDTGLTKPASQLVSPSDAQSHPNRHVLIPSSPDAISLTTQTIQDDMASLSMAPTPASPVEVTNRLLDNADWLPFVPVVYDTFSAYHNSNHGGIYRYTSIAVTSPDLDSNGASYALSAGARLWTLTTTPANGPAPFQARLEQYTMPPNLPRGATFYRRADQWLDRPNTKPVHAVAPRLTHDFDILDHQYTVVSTGQGKGAGQALGHEVQIWRPSPRVLED